MPAPRRIFVAATNQHVGKTTTTLGLIASLQNYGMKVGYCKPLGQKYIEINDTRVDKDAPIFTSFLNTPLIPSLHSPVIMAAGLTCNYLSNPEDFNFDEKVMFAARSLEATHDTVVYEGTGHPGVGSVLDMSNADTAKLLDAGVVLIVEGGIGKTIDQINLNKAYFEMKGAKVVGVIINKVLKNKFEKVQRVVGKKLKEMGIPLLGIIPYEKTLAYPVMKAVLKATQGTVVAHKDQLNQRVEGLMSFRDTYRLSGQVKANQLLIVDSMNLDQCIHGFNFQSPKEMPLSGIVLTSENYLSPLAQRFLEKYKIPTLFTTMNEFEAVLAFGKIETKLRHDVMWKVKEAATLVSSHLNLEPLFERFAYA
ncbi:MAG: dethiobiotin synthase [Bacteroidia bacterium]|nr:dethiobiotin synthase [Bacteroidia bacterium]